MVRHNENEKRTIMSDMKTYQTIFAFIGNFSPIFAIAYIIYLGFILSLWLVPVALTIGCNLIWLNIFSRKSLKNYQSERYKISQVKDIGIDMIAYFLTLSLSLTSILFLSPEKGLTVLAIIMFLVYILFNGNKIMLFNPFLSIFGYNELETETENGISIYLISKIRPPKDQYLNMLRLNDYIYYVDKPHYDSDKNDQLIVT